MAGIILTIEVDDKGSVKVKQFSDETKKAFEEMKKGPEAARGPLDSLSAGWVGLTAKVTIATGVIYGVTRALASFVEEAAEAESIERRLQFALEGAGYGWATAKSAVDQFAKSVMDSTRFSDEQARQALTDMMLYTNEFSKAETGARLAMDMSIRTGHDLSSSTRLIGMAMTGNVEMLGRYIPQLRNLDAVLGADATMAEKAAYALKILQERFGGTAQADLETYAGKVEKFKNQWAELREELGSKFLPILGKVMEGLTETIKTLNTPIDMGINRMLAGLPDYEPGSLERYPTESEQRFKGWGMAGGKKDVLPEDYSTVIKKQAEESAKAWGDYAQAELDALEKMFKDSAEDRIAIEKYTYEKILAGEQEFAREYREAWDAVYKVQSELDMDWVRNHELAQQRILAGEQELTDTIAEAWAAVYKVQIDEYNEKAKESDEIFKSIGKSVGELLTSNMVELMSATDDWGEKFKRVGVSILQTIAQIIAQTLIMNALFGNTKGEYSSGSGLIGIIGSALGGLVKMQEGGIVTRPTPALIGEAGPEAVIPLKDMDEGGRKRSDVNFYIYAVDSQSFVDMCERNPEGFLKAVSKSQRGGGMMQSTIRGVS